jgi:hypothetical protein
MSLFGRNRDDRRRRNLAEDLGSEDFASSATAASKPTGKGERYTAAGRRENRRHTSDFIPRRGWSLTVWFAIGLSMAAGLLVGFINIGAEANSELGLGPLLNAAQGDSLAGWFSSLMFTLAAVGSVLVYSIRRHRADDYRGRYRLWLWCAAAWMVMSIDATANLHTPFSLAMARATCWSMLGGAMWWIGVWGGILAILALRLLLEVRECRTATLGFTLAFSFWSAALATDYGWLPRGEHAMLVAIGGRLLGQVFLLFSVAFYARHVLLDAEGLLKIRAAKPKREKRVKKAQAAGDDDAGKAETSKTNRIDAAHKGVPQPNAAPLAARVKTASSNSGSSGSSSSGNSYGSASTTASRYGSAYTNRDEDEDRYSGQQSGQGRFDDETDDDSYGGGNRKLSKAERKRLRKQMRQQGRDED